MTATIAARSRIDNTTPRNSPAAIAVTIRFAETMGCAKNSGNSRSATRLAAKATPSRLTPNRKTALSIVVIVDRSDGGASPAGRWTCAARACRTEPMP